MTHETMNFAGTKIVATISPKVGTVEMLRKFYESGMSVARLNTAHLDIETAEQLVDNIRQVSDRIAIMIDTKGPNIRTMNIASPLEAEIGKTLIVSAHEVPGDKGFQVNFSKFVEEVSIGQHIILGDGEVDLQIESRSNRELVCRVITGGLVSDRKSVNVPGADLSMPALSQRDREFIDFAIRKNLSFIAHSFVRNRDDVMAVQSILDTAESPIQIIAKIENRQGVENLSSILDVAHGIMVARGDLGIEIPLEEVPLIQKKMIYECMRRCKPVITATQMLQSMENSPLPTRAEVSDVANAVFDGTDAVMLSGETAQGNYPVEAVKMMTRILRESEKGNLKLHSRIDDVAGELLGAESAHLVKSAIDATERFPIKAIVCNTATGRSSRMCAAFRCRVPIYAFSYNPVVVRQLALSYGVVSFHTNLVEDWGSLSKNALQELMKLKLIEGDDQVVLLGRHSSTEQSVDLCSLIRPGEMSL